MAEKQTIHASDGTREHCVHMVSGLLPHILMYLILPALGFVGFLIFDAIGLDIRSSLSAKQEAGLQVSGILMTLLIATAVCLSVSAYFFVREILRWRRPTA